MSELISGKEALIAIANGQDVEGNIGYGWYKISTTSTVVLNSFIFEKNRNGQPVEFRLKPRTITLNNIELPKPRSVTHCSQYPTAIEIDFDTKEQAIEFRAKFSDLW